MKKTIVTATLLAFSLPVLFAATISSTQSGGWNDTNTWDCACIPNSLDNITIEHDVTLDASTSVNSLTFGQEFGANSGIGTLVVGSNSTLTIATGTTDLDRSGNSLTIDDGSSMIKTSGDFTVSAAGTVTINGVLDVQNGDFEVSGGNNANLSIGVSGDLDVSADFTFAHSNQTINILGEITVGSMTANGGSNTTFNIATGAVFTITNDLNITTTQNFTVNGELNIGSVTVSGGSPDFVVNAGGVVNVTDDFNIASAGSIDISNTSGVINVGGDMNISGGADATVDGTLNIDGNLSIANNGNKIDGSGTVTAATADCPNDDCGIGTEGVITLPVTLSSFELTLIDETEVKIAWQTVSEINNDYFLLFKSTNGTDFELIRTIDGNGTTNEVINYEYLDHAITSGTYYYYLQQVDFDGQSEIFQTKKITIYKGSKIADLVYPSHCSSNSDVFLQAQPQDETSLTISLYNISSQHSTAINYQYEENIVRLQTSNHNLKSGIYLLHITYDQQSYTKRLIIN